MGAQCGWSTAVAAARIDLGVSEDDLPTLATELPVLPELLVLCDGFDSNPRRTQGHRACRLAIAAV
jgi:hypothetical protein